MAENKDRKAWVDAQLKARGLEATAENRKQLREEYLSLETGDLTESAINTIRTMFPAYAYLLDADGGGFGADVRSTIVKAVLQDYDPNRLLAELQGTAYFKTTSGNQRAFDALRQGDKDARTQTYVETITNEYGRGNLTDVQVNQIAQSAARNGLQGIQLRNYVFTQFINMQAKPGAAPMAGAERDAVVALGAKYYIKPTDSDINAVATGVLGVDDLEARYRTETKSLYPHLSQLIDSGSSLRDIAAPYVRAAQEILGVNEDEVDLFSASSKFRLALDSMGPDGNPRRMTVSEWVRKLRTDPNFGYQYTPQANQDATNIALSVARTFGKMM